LNAYGYSSAIATILICLIAGGCKEQGPLDGRWNGEWVSQGVVLDIGDVEFGFDYVEMAEGELRHGQLIYNQQNDEVQITQPSDQSFVARVRLISTKYARMTIRGMSGYIDLTRNG